MRDRRQWIMCYGMAVAAACGDAAAGDPSTLRFEPAALEAHHAALDTSSVRDATIAFLRDGDALLAKPTLAAEDAAGRFVFTDVSDKRIRRFRGDGSSERTIGRPGAGPGEFTSLVSAQPFGDSLLAWDFANRRLTIFDDAGVPSHSFTPSPTPFDIRVLDDQALLFLGHPGAGGRMLRIADPSGRRVTDFFERPGFAKDQRVKYLTVAFADGADGVVFAALFGDDSLFAFDYTGVRIGAVGLEFEGHPLPTIDARFTEAHGRMQGPDGRWFHDGMPAVMRVVALRGGRVAIQIARYDTKVGTDLLEGGEVQIFGVSRDEGLRRLITRPVESGLLGRARDGAPLFLGYTDSILGSYRLSRWDLP